MAKITQQQVYIIGVVLILITGAILYFTLIKPTDEETAAMQARYDTAKTTADKMPTAKADRAKAERKVAEAQAKWRRYDVQFMPNIDVSNLLTGVQQLWKEEVYVLGPKVRRFLYNDKTIQVVQDGITVPAPPSDPNAVNHKSFTFDLGTVAVAGNFNEILSHASRWNKFDRLVLMDNLTLSGNSPRLIGQYTLRAFEFTHNTDKPGPAIPQASSSTAGGFGGGGGGFGGPPPGFGGPGGPPSDGSTVGAPTPPM